MTHEIWKNAPEGATHYSPETDATHECFYKDDFKQMWVVKMPRIGWQEAHALNEHERPITRPTPTAIQTLEAELSALRTQAVADAAEIERLKKAIADAELRECKQLALYSKAEATIGAALIDIEKAGDDQL